MTAGTEDAFIKAVEQFPLLDRLQVLNIDVLLGRLTLEEGLDLLVLSIEVGHVNDQVFQDEHEHEW